MKRYEEEKKRSEKKKEITNRKEKRRMKVRDLPMLHQARSKEVEVERAALQLHQVTLSQ